MINKMKEAFNRLENAYKSGLIIYPRVDNDYLKGTPYAFYAHPKLNEFDEYAVPLEKKEYEFNRIVLPLYLCNKRAAKAASLVASVLFVHSLFDDSLTPKNEAELKTKNEAYNNFLTKQDLSPTFFYQKYFFKPRNLKGFRIKRKNPADIKNENRYLKKTDSRLFEGLEFKEADSFNSALNDFNSRFILYKNLLLKNSSNLINDC